QQWVAEPVAEQGGWTEVDAKNGFAVGDRLILLTPAGNHTFTPTALRDKTGQPIERAPGSGRRVQLQLPVACEPSTALVVRV
ncbi:U32 family peptidase C-terminal domain-containing protein, partial [Marinimicrobium alkaliphilum]|uniref:U32 family peptidase C-terminal domain-containing protein n=1 Tax=Marinimicrobium alkaliphilum TaxID=2202654 RepID=UPI0018E0772E